MPLSDNNIQDWMDWATGLTGAGQDDPLLSRAEIEQIIDDTVAQMGTFHTDPSTIPATATSRARGAFDSPNDLRSYLDGGGLLAYDDVGEPIKMPIVHLLKVIITGRANPIYEVWIDDETP